MNLVDKSVEYMVTYFVYKEQSRHVKDTYMCTVVSSMNTIKKIYIILDNYKDNAKVLINDHDKTSFTQSVFD